MWDDPHTGRPFLPRVLIADGGGDPVRRPPGIPSGTLLRDIDLLAVVGRMATRQCQVAVDLDSVRGLGGDAAAADFVMDTLGIGIVLSRRAHVAAHVAARGGLGLLHAHAFDSTGIARSLAAAPMVPGIGTVVSPASVLCHMRASERAALRRPVIGYGLLTDADDVIACLDVADAVVVRQDVADQLPAGPETAASVDQSLTPVAMEE
jgi:glycerol-3-phosphate responsive antiterminator